MQVLFPPSFKPMKGEPITVQAGTKTSIERVNFTTRRMVMSIKMDGVRCLLQDAGSRCWSGQMIELPNEHLHEMVKPLPSGIEFETMVLGGDYQKGNFGKHLPFSDVQSAVMKRSGKPSYVFYIFDVWNHWTATYEERLEMLEYTQKVQGWDPLLYRILPQIHCQSPDYVTLHGQKSIASGYEGLILKDLDACYKFGRSTFREQIMLKWKPYKDATARVVGYFEEIDDSGRPKGRLGALLLESPLWTERFRCGSGFNHKEREYYWSIRHTLNEWDCDFKYQESGTKDVPRTPIFRHLRHRGV
jgi:ATP-dependent DNA ligase